jgi:hypothetical protein
MRAARPLRGRRPGSGQRRARRRSHRHGDPAGHPDGHARQAQARSAFRRASPGLALSRLDVGAQAADEVPPALNHGLGGRLFPAAVLDARERRRRDRAWQSDSDPRRGCRPLSRPAIRARERTIAPGAPDGTQAAKTRGRVPATLFRTTTARDAGAFTCPPAWFAASGRARRAAGPRIRPASPARHLRPAAAPDPDGNDAHGLAASAEAAWLVRGRVRAARRFGERAPSRGQTAHADRPRSVGRYCTSTTGQFTFATPAPS